MKSAHAATRGRGPDHSEAFGKLFAAKERGDTEYLVRALNDPEVRDAAARYLGELGVLSAAPSIAKLLDATDPAVRVPALRALGRLNALDFLPRIVEIARDDKSDVVRSYAVTALGSFKDARANPTLSALLADSEVWIRREAATGVVLHRRRLRC